MSSECNSGQCKSQCGQLQSCLTAHAGDRGIELNKACLSQKLRNAARTHENPVSEERD